MEGERWERLGAGGGIVAVVLTAIGFLLPGTPPGPGDSAAKVVAFYADKRSALLLQLVLFIVALVFYLWFLGALRRALGRAEGAGTTLSTAVTAGGILLFAVIGAGLIAPAAIVWRGDPGLSASFVRVAYDGSLMALYPISAMPVLVFTLGASVLIWRSGFVPRWIAYLGVIEAAFNVLEVLSPLSRSGALAPGGAVLAISPFVWLAWVLAVSIGMTRPRRVVAATGGGSTVLSSG